MAWRSAFGVWRKDRCLGVVWRSTLGCGFAMGFVWVCHVWVWCGEGGVDSLGFFFFFFGRLWVAGGGDVRCVVQQWWACGDSDFSKICGC